MGLRTRDHNKRNGEHPMAPTLQPSALRERRPLHKVNGHSMRLTHHARLSLLECAFHDECRTPLTIFSGPCRRRSQEKRRRPFRIGDL